MLHQAFHPPEPPRLTLEQQNSRLKDEIDSYRQTLIDLQERLAEARARLALISQVVDDNDRCHRAPGTAWAAVRAALYVPPDGLRELGADLPIL